MIKGVHVFVMLLLGLNLSAQIVEGRIMDKDTGESIPYVNIGLIGKGIGTVGDEGGQFRLKVKDLAVYRGDTLRFSSISYEDYDLVIEDENQSPLIVQMERQILSLPEVIVDSYQFERSRRLGKRTRSDKIVFYFQSNRLGTELASLIKVKGSPVYIKNANFGIAENNFGEVLFRLNLYKSNRRGRPGEKLLHEDIIVRTSIRNGILQVDMSAYNLIVEDDFFLSLEWIESLNHGRLTEDLKFSASLGGGGIFLKETSQSDWQEFTQKKLSLMPALGFFVNVLQ